MKNSGNIFLTAIMIISLWTIIVPSKVNAQSYGEVSFDLFHNELSAYGHWDSDPHHGNIWFPSVEADFRPYGTNGHWTMTSYGNTWVSNYPWGWAPFHYGRWVYTDYRGWGWIPGYEWGPAWVDWRSGNGYYGWAPMAPAVSINISIGLPINLWIFTPSRRIYDRNIYRYSSYGRPNIYNNTTIINNTYVVNNNHYYGGPSRREVERSLGRRVTVRDINHTNRPGASRSDNRSVSIYRPDRNTNYRAASKLDRDERNTSIDRNNRTNRPTTDNRNAGSNRISREMYIGKDGNSSIRERNTDLNRNNTVEYPSTRNENKNNDKNIERTTRSSNKTERQETRMRRNDNESAVRSNNGSTTYPMRTTSTQTIERETRPSQEKKQAPERRSTNTVYSASQNNSGSSTGNRSENSSRTPRSEGMNRSMPPQGMNRATRSTSSTSMNRSTNSDRQPVSSATRGGSEHTTSRRNR